MTGLLLGTLVNGISYGFLLFMLSSGLTLVYSMMGIINFSHASFYMLGAYAAYALSLHIGFWGALVLAPVIIGLLGAIVDVAGLRRLQGQGHITELLFTFGLSFIAVELVQLIWGRAPVPYAIPAALEGALFTVQGVTFPVYRGLMLLVSVLMFVAIWLFLRLSRTGLVIQAALTHPAMTQALGHNVPRIFTCVFSAGCMLAALAGVIGGNAFVTEPGMAASVGSIIFVVVIIGGLGSVPGALLASLLIGVLQTGAVALDMQLGGLASWLPEAVGRLRIAQLAPVLPYLMLVLVLLLRPQGLMGRRAG